MQAKHVRGEDYSVNRNKTLSLVPIISDIKTVIHIALSVDLELQFHLS
jgi:hypothetical protein